MTASTVSTVKRHVSKHLSFPSTSRLLFKLSLYVVCTYWLLLYLFSKLHVNFTVLCAVYLFQFFEIQPQEKDSYISIIEGVEIIVRIVVNVSVSKLEYSSAY